MFHLGRSKLKHLLVLQKAVTSVNKCAELYGKEIPYLLNSFQVVKKTSMVLLKCHAG